MAERLRANEFRDWFFKRLIWVLMSGDWVVKIKDFQKSKQKKERDLFGLTDPHRDREGGIIYLDKIRGTTRILVHELGHAVLGEMLNIEAQDRNRTKKRVEEWTEDQVMIFERLFYSCLSVKQTKILQVFIDRAKIDFKKDI